MTVPTEYVGNLESQSASKTRVKPVVGWLVCVQGPDIGQDFRLHANYNYIGRQKNQDVCLSDPKVSAEHLTVSYDLKNNQYFIELQGGRVTNMPYINGQPLGGRMRLRRGDKIEVGDTMLIFIPLEQSDVKWNWKI